MSDHPKRIFGLDILRCAAILLVLLAHTISIVTQNNYASAIAYYFGLFGVEIFFVLSGFLIGAILIKTHEQAQITSIHTVKIFWLRRWFRTLPNYYLVIIVLEILYYPSSHFLTFSLHRNFSYIVFLQNFFTEMPDNMFSVSWSLAIEEWFYFLFPMMLLLVQYIVKSKSKAVLTVIIMFIAVPLLFRTMFSLSQASISFDQGYRKIVPLRLDAIGIGVLTAFFQYYYESAYRRWANRSLIYGVIVFATVLAFIVVTSFASFPYTVFIKETLFFSVLSISFALTLPYFSGLTSSAFSKFLTYPVTFISLISYSVYLIHQIIIFLVSLMLTKLGYENFAYLNFGLVWLFTITISYLQYQIFERRITALRDRFSREKQVVRVNF